ncbi:hypothetical protein THRCLA_04354 [Thraustotheca clavata]|uniref:Secreted protein n=1 Tax=Thraustotheca clavata TaxID=74557 RepID=A0A1V9ZZA3_9STRA|nr:hypothetical protein THRCLA_04354 [Thraustotheca clavata]
MFHQLLKLFLVLTSAAGNCLFNGKDVTMSGFIMDNYCIDQGFMVDNPTTPTLVHPEVHSIHCLVDVKACTDSMFAILAPPEGPNSNYTIKYQLGKNGTALAIKYAMAARNYGKRGFNATINGVDDGTSELKCISIEKTIMVDSKAVTLSATDVASATIMPMDMQPNNATKTNGAQQATSLMVLIAIMALFGI